MKWRRAKQLSAWMALLTGVGLGATNDGARLADAVQNQDQAAVRTLLKQNVDVNAAQADGTTALHWAVDINHTIP